MLSTDWSIFEDLRPTGDIRHISVIAGERAKAEIQKPTGLVRLIRDSDPERHTREDLIRAKTLSLKNVDDVSINHLLNDIYEINESALQLIAKDFTHQARPLCNPLKYPVTHRFLTLLADASTKERFKLQLLAAIQQHIEMSLTQSRKSNAGIAAEHIFESILIASGLREDIHYTKQFKTSGGSVADFVLPAVKPGEFSKVRIMVAVQISTNDRAKLTLGEHLPGPRHFSATFNGFDASTKEMKAIPHETIISQMRNGVRLVIGQSQREAELGRIRKQRQKKDSEALANREKYFSEYADSFEEFSEEMRLQFRH